MYTLESLDFLQDIRKNRLFSFVKAFVNFAIALSVCFPLSLFNCKIGDKVAEVQRTAVRNVDTIVGWHITNESISVVKEIVDYMSRLEARCSTFIDMIHVLVFATVCVCRKLK